MSEHICAVEPCTKCGAPVVFNLELDTRLRDEFAKLAMVEIIKIEFNNRQFLLMDKKDASKTIGDMAYSIADSMLKARG